MQLSQFKVFLKKDQIQAAIKKCADELNETYKNQEVIVLVVMNGAIFFASDLLKQLNFRVILDNISVSSYINTERSDKLHFHKNIVKEIENKHVLIIEDVIDSGHTLQEVIASIWDKKPTSVKTLCLVDKYYPKKFPYSYHALFKAPDMFLVGYGLDANDNFRQLEDIYFYEEKEK